jgi:phosphatidate cytidylyltransferase
VLRHRVIIGALLIAAVLAGLWLDGRIEREPCPPWLTWLSRDGVHFPGGVILFVVCVLLAVLGARELARILSENGVTASRRVTCTAAVAGLMASSLVPRAADPLLAVGLANSAAVVALLGAVGFYSRNRTVEGTVAAAGGALLSFVYVGVLLGFLILLRREHSAWVLLWVLTVAKTCDIGAYFTGRAIGRHKLIPWLSPGKTWEGLAGGMATASACAALGIVLLRQAGEVDIPSLWSGAAAGAVFAVVGQAGDLIESLFKRDAGRKDSGRMLPGFGGVLDLIDSPLLVAPAAYWWLSALSR